MPPPEQLQPQVIDKKSIIEKLLNQLKKMLGRKVVEEEAEKALKKSLQSETKEAQEREARRKREEDKQREYRKREAEHEEIESLDAARNLIAQEVVRNLNQALQDPKKRPEGSDYVFEPLRIDESKAEALRSLIIQNPKAAEIINDLVTQGRELHSDHEELLRLGQRLLSEAEKAHKREAATPILQAIRTRVEELIPQELEYRQQLARQRREEPPRAPSWLIRSKSVITTGDEQNWLKNEVRGGDEGNNWTKAIKSMLENPRPIIGTEEIRVTETGDQRFIDVPPPKELVSDVDKVWAEVEQREKTGEKLSASELKEMSDRIYAATSKAYPRDVLPGSEGYRRAVTAADQYVNEKLNALAERLRDRLRLEKPEVRRGIKDVAEFLREMNRKPGHLGYIFEANPEMEKMFIGTSEESRSFRDQVFLTIHSQILTQRRESSHENFGLYERADFTTFLNLIRSRLSDRTRTETGKTFGQTWVEWYASLSTTIRMSRDIDFWASQPGASIDDFQKSLALFQNEYSVQAMTIPAVEQAFRAYETVLRGIQAANDGYIPPSLVEYDPANQTAYWDDMSELMLKKMISMGVVQDAKRDDFGFHQVEADGHTVKLGDPLSIKKLLKEDPQNLQLALYMTLAKGFGMASLRYLEMFANSKVPGSTHPVYGMPGFHSSAYEGVARAGNYISMMIHKWRFGSYRYFHLMNMLAPNDHLKRIISKDEAMKAYEIYNNDPEEFKKIYGEKAKRFIDLTNFSKCSSAWGPPYTNWRHMDVTIGWTDKERELLGGSTQIMFAKKFAEAAVKNYLVDNIYREEFRKKMARERRPTAGADFDIIWQQEGLKQYGNQIDLEWKHLEHDKKIEQMIENYKKAFTARVWVETAMRNPLIVAHNVKINNKEYLHDYIVQKVLGIPFTDLKYGVRVTPDGRRVSAAPYASLTEEQRRYLANVLDLEGDLAAVRERAIRENRELTKQDFDEVISDKIRHKHALEYWQITRDVMLGFDETGGRVTPEKWYEKVGLAYSPDGQRFAMDWEKIEKIDKILEKNKETAANKSINIDGKEKTHIRIDSEWVDKEWEWMFGTDDTAFRQMDLLNLGSRQWVRRGGDWQAHYAGGQRFGAYLTDDLKQNPDPENLAKALFEIRKAYEGDMIEAGWMVAGPIAFATAKLYSWDWSRLGSAAQLDIWKTRRNVAGWLANGRRKFWDAVEHMDVLPPHGYGLKYDIPDFNLCDIHELRRLTHAENLDVWTEIIIFGYLLALGLTLWNAFTKPSEEEEEGGGGGGGHH